MRPCGSISRSHQSNRLTNQTKQEAIGCIPSVGWPRIRIRPSRALKCYMHAWAARVDLFYVPSLFLYSVTSALAALRGQIVWIDMHLNVVVVVVAVSRFSLTKSHLNRTSPPTCINKTGLPQYIRLSGPNSHHRPRHQAATTGARVPARTRSQTAPGRAPACGPRHAPAPGRPGPGRRTPPRGRSRRRA